MTGQRVFLLAEDCGVIEWWASGQLAHITVSDMRHTRQYQAEHPEAKLDFEIHIKEDDVGTEPSA